MTAVQTQTATSPLTRLLSTCYPSVQTVLASCCSANTDFNSPTTHSLLDCNPNPPSLTVLAGCCSVGCSCCSAAAPYSSGNSSRWRAASASAAAADPGGKGKQIGEGSGAGVEAVSRLVRAGSGERSGAGECEAATGAAEPERKLDSEAQRHWQQQAPTLLTTLSRLPSSAHPRILQPY